MHYLGKYFVTINFSTVSGTIPTSGTVYLFGGGITTSVTMASLIDPKIITIQSSSDPGIAAGDILGFSTINYFSGGADGNRFPAGMGFKNDQAYTGGANAISDFSDFNELPSLLEGDKIGFTITIPGSIDSSDGTGGQKITFQHYSGSTKTQIFQKFLPTHYFDAANKLHLLSSFNSNDSHDGPWSIVLFDSTVANQSNRHLTLELVAPP